MISSGGAGYLKRKEKEKKRKKKKKEAQKVGEGLRNYSWTNAIPLLPLARRSATNSHDLPTTSLKTYRKPSPLSISTRCIMDLVAHAAWVARQSAPKSVVFYS